MAQVNLSGRQKLNHRHREQACGCQGEVVGRRRDCLFVVDRYTLLHREWINNKVFLHSTGNDIQSPGLNYNGKNILKRMYIYV